ncbi:PID-CTERM protein-sorting domain-containing protein [Polaribacter huanghezhanensis]|uniref:PID-CTERM protein-sorting domain-containing protein n=1 Tax=Polaribacter huanghezhanensis TaxID=1354726 RepID=UPI00345248C3
MKNQIKILLFVAVLCTAFTYGQAAPPPVPPPPPPGLPIDGGVLFLFISGIILGVKKLKKN